MSRWRHPDFSAAGFVTMSDAADILGIPTRMLFFYVQQAALPVHRGPEGESYVLLDEVLRAIDPELREPGDDE